MVLNGTQAVVEDIRDDIRLSNPAWWFPLNSQRDYVGQEKLEKNHTCVKGDVFQEFVDEQCVLLLGKFQHGRRVRGERGVHVKMRRGEMKWVWWSSSLLCAVSTKLHDEWLGVSLACSLWSCATAGGNFGLGGRLLPRQRFECKVWRHLVARGTTHRMVDVGGSHITNNGSRESNAPREDHYEQRRGFSNNRFYIFSGGIHCSWWGKMRLNRRKRRLLATSNQKLMNTLWVIFQTGVRIRFPWSLEERGSACRVGEEGMEPADRGHGW